MNFLKDFLKKNILEEAYSSLKKKKNKHIVKKLYIKEKVMEAS